MKKKEIIPLKQGLDYKLTLPGSKSITNRALLCAALADGKSRLFGMLESDDTKVMMQALKRVGVKIKKTKNYIEVIGVGGKFKKGNFKFDLHNAGTATRFLTAIMAVRGGESIITGDKRMQERPIEDLVDGLRQIGVDVEYLGDEGYPPLKITTICHPELDSGSRQKTHNPIIKIKGNKSSQYFSALLMLGPLLGKSLKIEVIGDLVSKPYIDITISVMKAFGVKVKNDNYKSFTVKPQSYKASDYQIEGDASAASYWTSIAFLHGGKVKFENLTKRSIQGDIEYERVLRGLTIGSQRDPSSKFGMKKGRIRMKKIDMQSMPDVAMTLACTAPFFKGRTKITGLSTLRIKETDRLDALNRELNKIGVQAKITLDSITIGSQLERAKPATIKTYNDHRMAMCFAVIGTKIPGIVIENPSCTDKTYPNFWEDLERMYLSKKIKLGKKNLILTGMRCSGKSYLGRKIVKLLGRKFVDLDVEIEKDQGMKIAKIVKKYGWDHFRKVEQKICSQYSKTNNLVIATGGGVVLDAINMKNLLKNGINVFIFANISAIKKRLTKSGNRPSLTNKDPINELKDIWQNRRDLYLKYADFVWDNTGGKVVIEGLKEIFIDKD